MRLDREQFIQNSIKKYGSKFDYSKVDYIDSKTKVKIICTEKDENGVEHGEFEIIPNNHMHGNGGCKKCKSKLIGKLKKLTTEEFISRSKVIHGNKYDYSETDLNNRDNMGRVKILCPTHKEFWQLPNSHLKGCGCIYCSGVDKKDTNTFIKDAIKIHGDKYDYSKVKYINNRIEVEIICKKCGESFLQTPHNHLAGQGCRKCSYEFRRLNNYDENDEYIEKARKIHGDKYDYSLIDKTKYINIICPKHGKFTQNRRDHLQDCGCPSCGNILSKGEDEISQFIKNLGYETEQRNRKIIHPNELDIVVRNKKVAFEYNGLYWHSNIYKNTKYHINKTNTCLKHGIQLIHIFEDEWIYKPNIVKSLIKSILGIKPSIIIEGKKCTLKNVNTEESNEFLEKNHLKGKCKGSIRYGLYSNNELVSTIIFSKTRRPGKHNNVWEISRYCNKIETEVVDSFKIFLNYFINNNFPSNIIGYSDIRWDDDSLLINNGFKFMYNTKPDYYYVIDDKRAEKYCYRNNKKCKLPKIYDCGMKVYELYGS